MSQTPSTHSQRLTAVIASEKVVSTLPAQFTTVADRVRAGKRS
jgi:hypothetical protein